MNNYVLDTNFFIQAHRLNYPFDIFPVFWNGIKDLAGDGKILSIDKVKDEIFSNEDDLKIWCDTNLPNDFFKDTQPVIAEYAQIARWANSRNSHYTQAALNEFLSADEADAWLVAYGLKNQTTIVTHEISQPDRKNRIKIPEPCNHFNVNFINTIEMLRALRQSF